MYISDIHRNTEGSRAMNILGKLKFTSAPLKTQSPIVLRRNKLIAMLKEQKAMAEAVLSGNSYKRQKQAWFTNAMGERQKVQRDARVRHWWSGEGDNVVLVVRYGSKALELAKGKAAIEVGPMKNLPATVDTLIEAVAAGELDSIIAAAANRDGVRNQRPKKAA